MLSCSSFKYKYSSMTGTWEHNVFQYAVNLIFCYLYFTINIFEENVPVISILVVINYLIQIPKLM